MHADAALSSENEPESNLVLKNIWQAWTETPGALEAVRTLLRREKLEDLAPWNKPQWS